MLTVDRISSIQRLAELQADWDRLARLVFQRREWLLAWWDAYAPAAAELFVLRVRDEAGRTVGIAPWYRQRSSSGRHVRYLGDGKVCTDYQSLLARPADIEPVADAVGKWLIDADPSKYDGWDQLDFESTRSGDPATMRLTRRLAALGAKVCERDAVAGWRNVLPETWAAYEAGVKKRIGQRLRKIERRYLASRRASHLIAGVDEAWETLYDLFVRQHQARWKTIGVEGCFSCPEFSRFLRTAAGQLQQSGRLWLTALRIDGRYAATTFFLREQDEMYLYQCGMDPDLAVHQPGWVINTMNTRVQIELGIRACDYLRGHHRYKSELGAQPVRQSAWRIAAPHASALVRHQLWVAKDTIRNWGKQVIGSLWVNNEELGRVNGQ